MKKYTSLLLLIIAFISSSCAGGSRTDMLNRNTDEQIANEKLTEIIECIQTNDEDDSNSDN